MLRFIIHPNLVLSKVQGFIDYFDFTYNQSRHVRRQKSAMLYIRYFKTMKKVPICCICSQGSFIWLLFLECHIIWASHTKPSSSRPSKLIHYKGAEGIHDSDLSISGHSTSINHLYLSFLKVIRSFSWKISCDKPPILWKDF